MSRANPDALDMVVRHDRKLRRLPRANSGLPGPWLDLMDYIDNTRFFTIPTENTPPGIRLNNGWAEMRGTIFPDGDYDGGSVNSTQLPFAYWPRVAWAECFALADDDSSMEFWPYGGGWAVDVGGTGVAAPQQGFFTFDSPILVFKTTSAGAPTLQYTNVGNNHGWPMSGAKINLENVRWWVE